MVGFIESMCGKEPGAFANSNSKFAYGWFNKPGGRGTLLRLDHVWTSDKVLKKTTDHVRPVKRDVLFDLSYRMVVEGAFEELIREALDGKAKRYGLLYLGESDDMVYWVTTKTAPTKWVVPGNSMALPIKAGRGFGTLSPIYRGFAFLEMDTDEVPEDAWLEPYHEPAKPPKRSRKKIVRAPR